MKIKYPKFLLLILTYILAYLIVQLGNFSMWGNLLTGLGYAGSLITGIFYSYGFTSGPAAAVLILIIKSHNLILVALMAGIGALIGDLLIFKFFTYSFKDEIEKLSQERFFRQLAKNIPLGIRKPLTIILAAIVIGSPLPDEVGIFIMAAATKIKSRYFIPLSFILNTIGIYIILLLIK